MERRRPKAGDVHPLDVKKFVNELLRLHRQAASGAYSPAYSDEERKQAFWRADGIRSAADHLCQVFLTPEQYMDAKTYLDTKLGNNYEIGVAIVDSFKDEEEVINGR